MFGPIHKIIIHAPHLMAAPPVIPIPGAPQVFISTPRPPDATWGELHRRALEMQGNDDTGWLRAFSMRVPGGCACQSDWNKEMAEFPPDFSDYFGWTVARHNSVNRRLNKPELTVSQALAIWGA